MSLAFEAMQFAREVHAGQARKYTGNPYSDHLAEVAGIVATVAGYTEFSQTIIATAWLHDCIEDQDVNPAEVCRRFGPEVQAGVLALSDLEVGNRAERKAASRKRLASAPWWVQNIKVADLISNTSSIVQHDPNFAKVYLQEKTLLLDALANADARLLDVARKQVETSVAKLAGLPAAMCGACHAWGVSPHMTKYRDTRRCTICVRTEEQIQEMHGLVEFKVDWSRVTERGKPDQWVQLGAQFIEQGGKVSKP